MVYDPSLNNNPVPDVTENAFAAFTRRSTPIGNIWPLVNTSSVKWGTTAKIGERRMFLHV